MERRRERERKLGSRSETKRLGLDARGREGGGGGEVVHMCARVASYARDEQREATMRYRRADGWMEEGGWRMSGWGGVEFPLLYAVDFAFERIYYQPTTYYSLPLVWR